MNCFKKYNALLFLILWLTQACESDPILSPNAVDETEKVSDLLGEFNKNK